MDGFSLEGSEFRGGVDVRYKLTPDGRWEIQGYLPESELTRSPDRASELPTSCVSTDFGTSSKRAVETEGRAELP